MKALRNANPRDIKGAIALVTDARRDGRAVAVAGGGSDLIGITVPATSATTRSTYQKVMDREAWTHAVVSAAAVAEMDGGLCRRARIVLGGVAPIPWRLPEVERLLEGQRITEELAAKAGEASVTGARALSKNA